MTAPRRWLLVACAVSLSACASTPIAIPIPAPTEGIVYKSGDQGVEMPVLTTEVKPDYTQAAMRAKIQGSAWMECIVEPTGVCSTIKVVRSLDGELGLDQQAILALFQWRFLPGRKDGQPVRVLVTVEMNFTLK